MEQVKKAKHVSCKERSFDEVFVELMRNPETREAYIEDTPRWDFADALFDRRHECGMSRKELAKKSGVSKKKISLYENADPDSDPTLSELQALARAVDRKLVLKLAPRDEGLPPKD